MNCGASAVLARAEQEGEAAERCAALENKRAATVLASRSASEPDHAASWPLQAQENPFEIEDRERFGAKRLKKEVG